MPDLTSKLALAKPRGGSSGSSPAEQVDIDVLNGNFDKIDAAAGVAVVTSTTRPASPYVGQTIYETDTDYSLVYTAGGWAYTSSGFKEATGSFFGAVNSDGTTTINHGLGAVPKAVFISQRNHPSIDVNSRYFRTVVWGDPDATKFAVRNVDGRDNTWAGAQTVRFYWHAIV